MIRILVADDHDDVRRQIIRLIGRADDMQVTAEAADGIEVLERFGSTPADVLLLDLTMPRKGGIETLRELLPRYPDAKVLIVSMHPPEQLAQRMIRAGAKGYLGKDRVAEELHRAIRTIHAGGIYVDGNDPAPGARLTRRRGGEVDDGPVPASAGTG
jgi:two-component system, NarL family, invasion response regulator UvrY